MGAGEGDFVLHDGFWGPSQICKRSGLLWGPSGLGPERGLRGGSPEPHVFHSALCLEPAPRLLLPWKQNRGGGGGRSEAGLGPVCVGGEGRWGSRAVALVTGTEAPLRLIRVTACPPVPPSVSSLAPGPWPVLWPTPVLGVPFLFPDFFTPASLTTVLGSPSSSHRTLPDSKFS